MIIWQLFTSFFKIGLFTLGGGYAMLALIQQEIVRYGWLTPQEFVDVVGIAEVTPGPIAINAATFVGFRSAGLQGALLSSLAVVLPSLISVVIVSNLWGKYKNSQGVKFMFAGVRPVVVGLVGAAGILLGLTTLQHAGSLGNGILTLIIAGVTFYGVAFKNWDPIKVILGAALVGLIIF